VRDDLAERIAVALESIAADLYEMRPKPQPLAQMPAFHEMIRPASEAAWLCPVHGTAKTVPAGVSRKTGQPYSAFIVCGDRSCENRPPRPDAPERAYAPSQPKQLPG